ncbi:hypothetical protein B296_00021219 [Ensete ventricosum]|uniref:Uncharacterized protein n=1 Tax=Ensete ventricosum TaxID=4639 RepID=A0A426X8U5_ENSVE|nr:hypothetical protein B296_00021219 [Ensete ventricosum]
MALVNPINVATWGLSVGRIVLGIDHVALRSLLIASGRSEDNAVGNLPGVCWELIEGMRSLLGWHKGVRQKNTETSWKITEGSRKACQELGRNREARWEHARSSPKDDHKTCLKNVGGCRIAGGVAQEWVDEGELPRERTKNRRWRRPYEVLAKATRREVVVRGELLGGHSGVEAGGRKGRGSDDESGGAQLPKSKASVRKEVDSEEHHSATEADLPIAKEGTQMQDNG